MEDFSRNFSFDREYFVLLMAESIRGYRNLLTTTEIHRLTCRKYRLNSWMHVSMVKLLKRILVREENARCCHEYVYSEFTLTKSVC